MTFLRKLRIAPRDLKWVILAGALIAFQLVGLTLFTGSEFWERVQHRNEREILHLTSAPFMYIGIMWALWIIDRKSDRIAIRGWGMYVWPGVIGLLVIAALEGVPPWFVGPNGSAEDPWKSVLDLVQWGIGFGATAWALKRLTPMLAMVLRQIEEIRAK